MNWININSEAIINTIEQASKENPVIIFKHSTRCSISGMALSRLERSWKNEEMSQVKTYFLDLISFRNLSHKVAEIFNTQHQSPQLLLISDANCIYDASHMEISYQDLKKEVVQINA